MRDEAPAAIARLRALGLRVAIVSGDTRVTTGAVAAGLGVEAVAEATPVEKRAVVARLQAERRRVLFAGDGINDAPALTQADVGAAMARGTDVTMESADAVLVRDDLRLLPDLVQLSRRTYAVIRQNVFWAFFYNVVAIPLAMAGVLHPIVAAAAMAASSLFVVLNSLRLRGALRLGDPPVSIGFLIVLSLALGVVAWLFFVWTVKSGQYDDPEGPKYRMLDDDEGEAKPRGKRGGSAGRPED